MILSFLLTCKGLSAYTQVGLKCGTQIRVQNEQNRTEQNECETGRKINNQYYQQVQ
jgi:hypothetical protein